MRTVILMAAAAIALSACETAPGPARVAEHRRCQWKAGLAIEVTDQRELDRLAPRTSEEDLACREWQRLVARVRCGNG